MNKIQQLIEEISKKESQSSKNKKVTKLIKNTSLPLEARWELYTTAVQANYLIEEDGFYLDLDEVGLDLDDVGYYGENRHGQYSYWDILDSYREGEKYEEVTENKIKEIILQDGSSSWTYDW